MGAIIPAPYNPGTGGIDGTNIADNSITSAKIVDGTIQTQDIGTDQITSSLIASGAVGASEIADGTVGNAELASNAVTSAKVQDASLLGADLANATIPVTKLLDMGAGGSAFGGPMTIFNGVVTLVFQYEVTTAGVYLIVGWAQLDPGGGGFRFLQLSRDATVVAVEGGHANEVPNLQNQHLSAAGIITCSVGQMLTMHVAMNNGTTGTNLNAFRANAALIGR